MFTNIDDALVYNNDNVHTSLCAGGGSIYSIPTCVYLASISPGNNDTHNSLEPNVNIALENSLIAF